MRRSFVVIIMAFCLSIGCAPLLMRNDSTRYSTKLLYVNDKFTGASLSGQSVLILPVLTEKGPDTFSIFSPYSIGGLLSKNRNDLRLVLWKDFENKYLSYHDFHSLDDFYSALFRGNILYAQTSDSIWQAIDAHYMLVIRVRYAALIKGFYEDLRRRLSMEVELWDTRAPEAVWRAEVSGFGHNDKTGDDKFIEGALLDAFSLIPGYMPVNNETDW
ncbi:MAG TPA: hypothetical protein DCO75_13430 [Fibrobacteres bacterium]|jgi:hypothetical protein|nr:hypothetical protein [Fibrobacterota bacterium]